MTISKLKTIELNVQDGKLIVNGIERSKVSYFKLEFDGDWTLSITENFDTFSDKFRVRTGEKKHPEKSGA